MRVAGSILKSLLINMGFNLGIPKYSRLQAALKVLPIHAARWTKMKMDSWMYNDTNCHFRKIRAAITQNIRKLTNTTSLHH